MADHWLTDTLIVQVTRELASRGASPDVIQDTFVKLLELPEPPRDVLAWARSVSYRDTISHSRKAQTQLKYLYLTPPPPEAITPERSALLRETVNRLNREHWRSKLTCAHKPRYGRFHACYRCYRRAWTKARKGAKS